MLYDWIVLIHVAAVFAFLLAHGVSAFVVFRVRAETDVTVLRALLNLSMSAVIVSSISLGLVIIFGVIAAFMGHWWGHVWPWAAIGILVVVWGLMSALTGQSLRRVRVAVGITGPRQPVKEPASSEEIAKALARVQPWESTIVGGVGLLLLLWLMILKPF